MLGFDRLVGRDARWLGRALVFSGMLAGGSLADVGVARADDVAEAEAFFQRGNEHFQRGVTLRGPRRTRELETALRDYMDGLRLVRSRNVLYNTALLLEQLGRVDEAFNFWTEYTAIADLSEAERQDGQTRRDALRPRVAVIAVESSPAGATVHVDRRDLDVRGRTPFELAVGAGHHRLFVSAPHHREGSIEIDATLGTTTPARVTLEAAPVAVQVLAPEGASVTLDGHEIASGANVETTPGAHVVTLRRGGTLLAERHFEIASGSAPVLLDLASANGSVGDVGDGLVRIEANVPSRIFVDGVERGDGRELELRLPRTTHHFELVANGRATASGDFVVDDHPRTLDAELARTSVGGVHTFRWITGIAASLGLVGGAISWIDAGMKRDAWSGSMSDANATALEQATLRTDVIWVAEALVGATAIVSLLLDAGGGASEIRFAATPLPEGGFASLSLDLDLGGLVRGAR